MHVRTLSDTAPGFVLAAGIAHDDAGPVDNGLWVQAVGEALDDGEYVSGVVLVEGFAQMGVFGKVSKQLQRQQHVLFAVQNRIR